MIGSLSKPKLNLGWMSTKSKVLMSILECRKAFISFVLALEPAINKSHVLDTEYHIAGLDVYFPLYAGTKLYCMVTVY